MTIWDIYKPTLGQSQGFDTASCMETVKNSCDDDHNKPVTEDHAGMGVGIYLLSMWERNIRELILEDQNIVRCREERG